MREIALVSPDFVVLDIVEIELRVAAPEAIHCSGVKDRTELRGSVEWVATSN